MKRVVFAVLALAASCASGMPVYAQAPEPSPSGWNATLYTGAVSVITRGERHEYLAGRLELEGPLAKSLDAFLRVDVTGEQDGGTLDYANPSTFRSLQVHGGAFRKAGVFDVGLVGGTTFSIEGQTGAPIDPHMLTGVVLVRGRLRKGGYVGAGGGWYGPVGGYAGVLTTAIPVSSGGAYATTDLAIPTQANALAVRSWRLTVGARVLLKRVDLGQVFGK
jgi:hypothetical protein